MAAYEVLLLNTAVPQIQAAQAGDTYVVPRDIAVNANMTVTGNVGIGTSAPAEELHITAAIPTIRLEDSDDGSRAEILYNVTSGGLLLRADQGSSAASASNIIMQVDAVERLRIDSSGGLIAKPAANGHAVFNEDGVDADFRVESDTNTHALFVQGSDGFVGIGTSSPSSELEVLSTDSATAIRVSSGAASTTTGTSTLRLQAFNSASGVIGSAEISNTAPAGGQSILTFATSPSGNAPTERLRIKSTGQVRFVPLAADPAGAEAGDVYYNSGTNKLRLYNGTSWVDLN